MRISARERTGRNSPLGLGNFKITVSVRVKTTLISGERKPNKRGQGGFYNNS